MERLREKGFLKLPEVENIKVPPSDPYTGATEGVIHAQKFIKVFEYVSVGGDWHDILDIFEGHQMYSAIQEFTKNKMADLCRHIIYANKDKIGWELVDELILRLDRLNFIPQWELPNSELYNSMVNEIYTTIINLKLEESISNIFTKIVDGFEELDIYRVDLKSKMNSKFQVWNYKDLIELFELLHDPKITSFFDKRNISLTPLINKISRLFIETIENPITTIYQRIGLTMLFLKVYMKQGNESLMKSQELIDLIWKEIDKLTSQEKISFRTLLGATYSFLIHQIFITQSDFITRRKLLGRIISNFISIKDFEIKKWFISLTSIQLNQEVLYYILQGYSAFISSLNMHINELPPGKIQSELLDLSKNILSYIKDTFYSYLTKYQNLPDIYQADPGMYVYQLSKLDFNRILMRDTQNLLISIVELQLSTGSYMNVEYNYEKEIDVVKAILESDHPDVVFQIFNLKARLLLREYPFDNYYIKILEEFIANDTIILSPTFEKEIIKLLSITLDYLLKADDIDTDYRRTTHEFLVLFLGEWLNTFSENIDLYNEAFMLLAPIVSINFVQIIREYFVKNKINKAFLTYLNMYYFTEYFIFEIKRSDIWRISEETNAQKAKISNKFHSIIKDWKIEELLNMDDIKKSVTNIEMSIVEAGIKSSSTLSGMIEDEIVLGYLDNIQRLESFISKSSEDTNKENDLEADLKLLYTPPVLNPMNPYSLIGYTKHIKFQNEIPFPIIRDIHSFTVAMEMFPISTSFIDFIGNENLYDSFIEIMSLSKGS